jgi:hypothetical protein
MVTVRTLREDEPFPQHLGTGFEAMPVMKSFCWVAEHEGRIVGMLMAAPCHGLAFFVRLRVDKGAPISVTSILFRKCIKDCEKRGLKGYFTFIDPSLDLERRMISICHRAKGFQIPSMQVGLVGRIEDAARF